MFTTTLFKTAVNAAAIFGIFLASNINAQEWSRFRGPNGNGVGKAEGLPVKWTDNDYAWTTQLPGVGHSSPVLWGTKIFLLSADPQTAERYVLCVDSESGKILWKNSYPSKAHRLHARSSYGSSTPAVDENHVYVAWSEPNETTFMALDHDGNEVWSLNLGSMVSQHGFGTSPIIYKDNIILFFSQQSDQLKPGEVAGESKMMAFNRKNGVNVWSTNLIPKNVCYSVPCIYQNELGQDELISTNTRNGFFSLNPDTGKINWEFEAFSMRTVASPVIAGGLIFGSTGSGKGGNYTVAFRPGKNPEIVYKMSRSANYVPTPVAYKDLIFLLGDKGIGTCLDIATGKTHWQERTSRGTYSASPVIVGNKIYAIDDDGVVNVIEASKDFNIISKIPLGETCRATPAVANNTIFFRTESKLMAIKGVK